MFFLLLLNLEEEETSDDGQKKAKNWGKVWASKKETNLDVGDGTATAVK